MYLQTLKSFDDSNRMYAIPAETASQGQPFQKENLPGPGKLHPFIGMYSLILLAPKHSESMLSRQA